MTAAFQQAALPEPFKVLGKDLAPYTLGHDILLGLFESSFCRGVSLPQESPFRYALLADDLPISVWVCSHAHYSDVYEKLQSPEIRDELKKWGKSCGEFDVPAACITFERYLKDNTQEPGYWVEDAGRGRGGSSVPFSHYLKVVLMREFGLKEHEALDTPYAQALWNYLTILEGQGRIRFMSDDDSAALNAAMDPELDRKLQALAARVIPQNN
jgi:hypothetical protein